MAPVRAVQVVGFHGPPGVVCREIPGPEAGPDDVLVEVHAAGVAFPDVLHTRGEYQERHDPPFTLGGECAGVVRAAPSSSPLRPGDRVAVLLPMGAFAEVVAAPAHLVLPLPDPVSFDEGACLPINYLTAHFALGERAGLRAGETVLVHGAAGGIGTATVQLAVALGARVVAVTSTSDKAALARKVGAHEVVDAATFRAEIAELTGGEGVDVVVDPVGGDRFTDSLRCLRPRGGRLLVVGFTAGEIPTVKVNRLLLTNTDVRGVGWAKPAFAEPGFVTAQWQYGVPFTAPLRRTREYVEIVRRALSGERLVHDGREWAIPTPGGLGLGKPLKMLGPGAVHDDLATARDLLRPVVAFYLGGMGAKGKNFYTDLAVRYGHGASALACQDRFLAGDRRGAEAALTPELIDTVAIAATPATLEKRLAAFADAGVDMLVVTPFGDRPGVLDAVAGALSSGAA